MTLLFLFAGTIIGFAAAFLYMCNKFAEKYPPLHRDNREHQRE